MAWNAKEPLLEPQPNRPDLKWIGDATEKAEMNFRELFLISFSFALGMILGSILLTP